VDRTGLKVDFNVIRMRQGLRAGNAERPTPLELSLPRDLVIQGHPKFGFALAPVLALRCTEKLGEEALRPLASLRGVDGERSDDGLRNRDGRRPVSIVDRNHSIRLFADDSA
jgi:hypothetical protein